jgi:RHS repeat-associated protein
MRRSFKVMLHVVAAAIVILINQGVSYAQANGAAYGTNPWTVPLPVQNGYVDAANGNLHIEIPIASIPQRGHIPFVASLVYDSHIWGVATVNNSTTWQPTGVPNSWGGWRLVTSAATGGVGYTMSVSKPAFCGSGEYRYLYTVTTYTFSGWETPDGHMVPFNNLTTEYVSNPHCGGGWSSNNGLATDASGYHMYITNYTTVVIYAPDGTQVYPNIEDTNGNFYSVNSNGNIVDTLGRTPITMTANGNTTTYAILNSAGSTSNFVVTTESIPVNTAFGQTGVAEYSGNVTVVQSIALPDGSSYQFNYDQGSTGTHFGTLTGMTLPTGGTDTYTHSIFQYENGANYLFLTAYSSSGGQWSYTPAVVTSGSSQQVTVTQPSNDQEVYTFTSQSDGNLWNTQAQFYSGTAATGTLLSTATTDYNTSNPPVVQPIRYTTTVQGPSGNLSKKVELTWDSNNYGNIVSVNQWNYYPGSFPSSPDRVIAYTYLTNSNNNMVNKKATIQVCVTTACTSFLSKTQITYDSTYLVLVTGATNHDDTHFGTSNLTRGNPTLIQQWWTASNYVTTTNTYDTTGQLTQSVDTARNTTTLRYADNFFNDSAQNPPSTYTPTGHTNAYLTQVTQPLIGSSSFGYYYGTGELALSSDPNGATSYFHYLDPFSRATHAYGPLGAWMLASYTSPTTTDIYGTLTDTQASAQCSSCRHDQIVRDQWGRTINQYLVSDPDGHITVNYGYDSNSRIASVTNPYRPNDTIYTTQPAYDGLNRTVSLTQPDSAVVHAYYGAAVSSAGGAASQLCASQYGLGFPVLRIDESGKKSQTWTDGLGRMIEADQADSNGNLTVAACYQYDLLGNLLQSNQGGQTRTFTYDKLSRVTAASTPESGNSSADVNFYYTTSSGGFCAGDPSAVCRRVDNRLSVTTTYAYDALNRLTSVTYSDSTPTLTFTYDQGTNQKGRRTGMSDGSGSTTWSYNLAGNLLSEQRTIASAQKTTSYSYLLNNALSTITYPSGRVVTYSYDTALRPVSAVDNVNSINFVTQAHYAAHGALKSYVNGATGSFAGITTSNSYNSRLQPSILSAAAPSQTVFSLSFSYVSPNNGNIAQIVNNIDNTRTQNFTYDNLNRLLQVSTQATSGSFCWGDTFGYDQYGNIQTATPLNCGGANLNLSVNANNWITNTGITFDAAGRLTQESYSYTWNSENQLTGAAGATYQYDGDQVRVNKSTGRLYWRGGNIGSLDETDSTGNTVLDEYVYFAGLRVARTDSSNNTYYYFSDQIGSTRVVTQANGTVCYDADFQPFGYEVTAVNGCPPEYKFATYERDSESGLDYAVFRHYNSRLGRFISPDPIGGDPSSPQSLNRYTYVGNNSLNGVDPLGLHQPVCGGNLLPGWIAPLGQGCYFFLANSGFAGAGFAVVLSGYQYGDGNYVGFVMPIVFGPYPGAPRGFANSSTNPCATAKTIGIPVGAQSAQAQGFGGIAVSSISFSEAGPINGLTISSFTRYSSGGVTIPAFTTISIQYNGPDSGLSIGATNPVTLETGTSLYKASADLLQFNNGQVTNVNGEVDLLSLIPIPGGSQTIQDYLNSNSDALKALRALSAALGECAKTK